MDEKNLRLLKYCLKIGEMAAEEGCKALNGYEYIGNDFYDMMEELAEALGVSCSDLSD